MGMRIEWEGGGLRQEGKQRGLLNYNSAINVLRAVIAEDMADIPSQALLPKQIKKFIRFQRKSNLFLRSFYSLSILMPRHTITRRGHAKVYELASQAETATTIFRALKQLGKAYDEIEVHSLHIVETDDNHQEPIPHLSAVKAWQLIDLRKTDEEVFTHAKQTVHRYDCHAHFSDEKYSSLMGPLSSEGRACARLLYRIRELPCSTAKEAERRLADLQAMLIAFDSRKMHPESSQNIREIQSFMEPFLKGCGRYHQLLSDNLDPEGKMTDAQSTDLLGLGEDQSDEDSSPPPFTQSQKVVVREGSREVAEEEDREEGGDGSGPGKAVRRLSTLVEASQHRLRLEASIEKACNQLPEDVDNQ